MIRQFDGNEEIKTKCSRTRGSELGTVWRVFLFIVRICTSLCTSSLMYYFYQVPSAFCDKSIVDHYSYLGTIMKDPVPEFLLRVASVRLGDFASETQRLVTDLVM